jgi:glutamyl-tRNA synthetase
MADQALFYYQDEVAYDPDAAKKFLNAEALPALRPLTAKLAALENYTETALEDAFKAVMRETGLKLGMIAQPVRVALSGRAASPGIFEITAIIGKEKTLARLGKAIDYIEGRRNT